MFLNEYLPWDNTNVLISIVTAVIVYFAWKSTNVREDRFTPSAVLIIENRRRMIEHIIRTSNSSVSGSSTIEQQTENSDSFLLREAAEAALENLNIPAAPPSLQSIFDEVNGLASSTRSESNPTLEAVEEEINQILRDTDTDPQRIVEIMDNQTNSNVLHRRRTNAVEEAILRPTPIRRENLNAPLSLPSLPANDINAENCSNENNENENKTPVTTLESTQNFDTADDATVTSEATALNNEKSVPSQNASIEMKREFRIKLKYLNDELRLVKGSPNEAIGDFKKRNFTVELAGQKLVRLVFNGHVLQPDSKTLQACGLFDNCVVHCLIHNKKPSQEDTLRNNQNTGQSSRSNGSLGNLSEGSSSGVSMVYFGIILSGLSIIFGWYCRFTYSFIFSWYSTIGLALMTIIFLVLSPVLFLIERGVSL